MGRFPATGLVTIIKASKKDMEKGKIIMEEYGQQFNFFKYCMLQAYNQFPIASALRVYITGQPLYQPTAKAWYELHKNELLNNWEESRSEHPQFKPIKPL
jgi:hypothetical protein